MSLRDRISIDTIYTRSINIERDKNAAEIAKAYIPTSRSLMTLKRFAETLNDQDLPRSWALIGPYGSGKSSFAVFLNQLINNRDPSTRTHLFKAIQTEDKKLAKDLSGYFNNDKGLASILITGSPEPLAARFLLSLEQAANQFWSKKGGTKPAIIQKISDAIEQSSVMTNKIVELVGEFRQSVEKSGGKGVLIVFDELGKFLEYEARHYGANDIFLLQSLAELAMTGHHANLYLFSLMHQGFEQYARGLGQDLRNEWSKIQGRFENIPFLETTEQTLRIISKAFKNKLTSSETKNVQTVTDKITETLENEKALPGILNQSTATDIFSNCYPLHPISALILPTLCQKMAQNERTLFSYLGSKEQNGFQNSLEQINNVNDWIYPWEIYDYFILNQPAILTDPTTHRRWAEVVTAIERLGDAPEDQIRVLKTIGLLNIIGIHGGLKASKKIIELSLKVKINAHSAASALIEASVIQFRKYSNEYRVWQGSDFALDEAIHKELGQLGYFNLSEAINTMSPLPPIVARRHTIETGALRYFVPSFTDRDSYLKILQKTEHPRIIICLTENREDILFSQNEIITNFDELNIVGIIPNGAQLREIIGEVLALKRIEQNYPDLYSDSVALREFNDRFSATEQIAHQLLSNILEKPIEIQWYWKNKQLKIVSKRNFQQQLSIVLNEIYKYTPKIFNELINREKPSAQASAARNKLVSAMVNHIEKADVGIEKFPAEKAIYRAFLQASGLHIQDDEGVWRLTSPSNNDKYNFYPVWQRIDQFLLDTQVKPKSFDCLTKDLKSPPYGIKYGVLPLIYLTVFLSNQDELALYEHNNYVPYITEQHIERFMKNTSNFAVQLIRLRGIRASLFKQYMQALIKNGPNQKPSLIAVAKPLAQFMANLEPYTRNTNRISDAARKMQKTFDISKSPNDLLFKQLPMACGFSAINPDETDERKIEGFTIALVDIIRELKNVYSEMINRFSNSMIKALLPDNRKNLKIYEFRKKVKLLYENLIMYTADIHETRKMIEYLSEEKSDDALWLKRILLFLGDKVPEQWSDIDHDSALKKMNELSRRLIDIRVIQDQYLKKKTEFENGFDVIRLRSMRHGNDELEEIVVINEKTKNIVNDHIDDILIKINKVSESENKLALLAVIVERVLNENKKIKTIKEEKVING